MEHSFQEVVGAGLHPTRHGGESEDGPFEFFEKSG
jgi:hypothetical protein